MTRADFYVGRGLNAEWIGSVISDGNEILDALPVHEDVPLELLLRIRDATHEREYRAAVLAYLLTRAEEGILPERGWPWSYNSSVLTQCVYAFDDGQTWCSEAACEWVPCTDLPDYTEPDDERAPIVLNAEELAKRPFEPKVRYPDMAALRKPGSQVPNDGLLIVRGH